MSKSINKSGHQLIWPDRLLVFIGIRQKEKKTESGIYLGNEDSAKFDLLARTEGVVVEIGEKCFVNSANKPKPKDLVCFPQNSASSVIEGDDGGMYFVLKDTSINTIHKK